METFLSLLLVVILVVLIIVNKKKEDFNLQCGVKRGFSTCIKTTSKLCCKTKIVFQEVILEVNFMKICVNLYMVD